VKPKAFFARNSTAPADIDVSIQKDNSEAVPIIHYRDLNTRTQTIHSSDIIPDISEIKKETNTGLISEASVTDKQDMIRGDYRRSMASNQMQVISPMADNEDAASCVSSGSSAEWATPPQSIVIFDWDDTLCPSSWIRWNRPLLSYFRPPPNEERFVKPLAELQDLVLELLELSMKLGKVVIVTNAREPWVTTSCTNFMPKVLRMLDKIPVVYAQSIWETWGLDATKGKVKGRSSKGSGLEQSMFMRAARSSLCVAGQSVSGLNSASTTPGSTSSNQSSSSYQNNPNARQRMAKLGAKLFAQSVNQSRPVDMCLKWKELAFGIEITEFYSRYNNQSWKNVISIGDADYERMAAKNVVEMCSPVNKKKKRIKTLKLLEEPTIEELILQVKKIKEAIQIIVLHDGNLDIEIDEHDLGINLPDQQ